MDCQEPAVGCGHQVGRSALIYVRSDGSLLKNTKEGASSAAAGRDYPRNEKLYLKKRSM